MDEINKGDVVVLKSGSVSMTVLTAPESYDKLGMAVKCMWMLNGKPMSEIFPIDAIELRDLI